jgi:hypothetical protein
MLRLAIHRPASPSTVATSLLGADHPYVVAERDLYRGTRGLLLTAVFVATSAALADPGPRRALTSVGAFVLLLLVLRVVLASDLRRQCALDLVLGGHETLAIPAVTRLRGSLLGRRRDDAVDLLMRTLDAAVARAEDDPTDPPPIVEARDDVAEIVALLRTTHSARAVAMTTCLLQGSAGWSVLTGDPEGLRRELGRIRFLLAAEDRSPPVVWLAP